MAPNNEKRAAQRERINKGLRSQGGPLHGFVQFFARLSRSRGNLYTGLSCDWLIGLVLLAAAWRVGGTRLGPAVLALVVGFFVFSFIEYAAHRWLFHRIPGPFREGHARHHADPDGYDAMPFFIPPLVMCALAAAFAVAVPAAYALLLAGAVAIGYALYGSSHTVLHIYRFRGPVLRPWQEFHDVHHDHPNKNFGVTTPLWDFVFGTCYHGTSAPKNRQH